MFISELAHRIDFFGDLVVAEATASLFSSVHVCIPIEGDQNQAFDGAHFRVQTNFYASG